MQSLHFPESRSHALWHGGAVAIGAAALVLIALVLVADRHGPGSAMPMTAAPASEAPQPSASVASTSLAFDVSSRVLPDELPPPAEPADGNGSKP